MYFRCMYTSDIFMFGARVPTVFKEFTPQKCFSLRAFRLCFSQAAFSALLFSSVIWVCDTLPHFCLFAQWDGAVSSITWCCVAYIQKVYIQINSKTKLCSVEETISVMHTYIYMNNVFLHLIYYFYIFLFRHVWRNRTQNPLHLSQLSHRGQLFRKRQERDTHFPITQWAVPQCCAVFCQKLLAHFLQRLLTAMPHYLSVSGSCGSLMFHKTFTFHNALQTLQSFLSQYWGVIKFYWSLTKCPIICRGIEAIF